MSVWVACCCAAPDSGTCPLGELCTGARAGGQAGASFGRQWRLRALGSSCGVYQRSLREARGCCCCCCGELGNMTHNGPTQSACPARGTAFAARRGGGLARAGQGARGPGAAAGWFHTQISTAAAPMEQVLPTLSFTRFPSTVCYLTQLLLCSFAGHALQVGQPAP